MLWLYRGALGFEGHVERLIYPPLSRVPLLQETTKNMKPTCSATKIRGKSAFVKRNGLIGVLVQIYVFASSAGCARAQQACTRAHSGFERLPYVHPGALMAAEGHVCSSPAGLCSSSCG
jgi:hypothetical protein